MLWGVSRLPLGDARRVVASSRRCAQERSAKCVSCTGQRLGREAGRSRCDARMTQNPFDKNGFWVISRSVRLLWGLGRGRASRFGQAPAALERYPVEGQGIGIG